MTRAAKAYAKAITSGVEPEQQAANTNVVLWEFILYLNIPGDMTVSQASNKVDTVLTEPSIKSCLKREPVSFISFTHTGSLGKEDEQGRKTNSKWTPTGPSQWVEATSTHQLGSFTAIKELTPLDSSCKL